MGSGSIAASNRSCSSSQRRPGAAHRRDVLADAGEVERPVARVVERRRQPLRKRRRAREAEHRHDAAAEQRLHDLIVDLRGPLSRRANPGRASRPGAGSAPGAPAAPGRARRRAHDEGAARVLVGLERLGLASRAVVGLHQQLAGPLAQRLLGDERLELARRCRRGVRARRRRRSAPRARPAAAPRAARISAWAKSS